MLINDIQQIGFCEKRCTACGATFDADIDLSLCPNDGKLLCLSAHDELTGTVISGKYRIDAIVGRGGWSSVYRAYHLALNKVVAVKVLHPHLAMATQQIRRFELEARALLSLRHNGIVSVFDYGLLPAGNPFVAMDYLDGVPLSDVIRREAPLTDKRVVHIFLQVCDALSEAHRSGIIHRDLKPGNLMLLPQPDGTDIAMVVDFGLARCLDPDGEYLSLTATGEVLGTPAYMSPEHCLGHKVDHRSDIYALGCTLYEALTGQRAFVGETTYNLMVAHLNTDPPPFSTPSTLEPVARRCLEREPDARYQSIEELSDALSTSAMSSAQKLRQKAVVSPTDRSTSPMLIGLLLFAALITTVVGGVHLVVHGAMSQPIASVRPNTHSPVVETNGLTPPEESASSYHFNKVFYDRIMTMEQARQFSDRRLPSTYEELARSLRVSGQYERAEYCYKKAIYYTARQNPNDYASTTTLKEKLAEVQIILGKHKEAEKLCRELLDIQTYPEEPYRRQIPAAQSVLQSRQAASYVNCSDSELWNHISHCGWPYISQPSAPLYRGDQSVHLMLADLVSKRSLGEAMTILDNSPQAKTAQTTLARARLYAAHGQYITALSLFQDAANESKYDPIIPMEIGSIYHRLGSQTLASKYWNQANELAQRNPPGLLASPPVPGEDPLLTRTDSEARASLAEHGCINQADQVWRDRLQFGRPANDKPLKWYLQKMRRSVL